VTDTTNVPPGWYPDANATGGQRWWDGTRWTEHVGAQTQPYQAFAPLKAPEGTKTGTVWIWLIVLLPLLGLVSIFTIDWKGYIDSIIPTSLSGSPTSGYSGMVGLYTSPGYLISVLLSWASYGATVVFAALDVRELKKRGVPQPFHWAFAFLTSIVYVIGRSVVVKRRTGGGLGPLWAYIIVYALGIVAGIVLSVLIFQYMFAAFPTTIS
jgi:hypothetical protein